MAKEKEQYAGTDERSFGLYQVMMWILQHGVITATLHGAVYEDEREAIMAVQELNTVAKENDFTNTLYYVKTIKANRKHNDSTIII